MGEFRVMRKVKMERRGGEGYKNLRLSPMLFMPELNLPTYCTVELQHSNLTVLE